MKEKVGQVAQGNARKIENSIIFRTNPSFYLGDKWSRMYCSEYFNVFEYLVPTSHEIKNVGGILSKPAPKKGKSITNETLHLVINIYEDGNFSRQGLNRKNMLV